MNIIVSKDIVKLNENHSENHYGEYNVNECVFEFDEYFDSVPIKKAIFTSQSNNKSFEIDIINNKCTVPHEVLTKVYDTVILGVYGYDVNEETLLVRYSPEPTTFVVHEGSYKEGAERPEIITPTQYDMYSKALQEGLAEVDKRLDDVEKQGDYASEQGDYAKEQGDYAKEQGTNAKNVADDTQKKAEEGKFNGKSLEFVWQGTKLGIRLEGQEEYQFVDLQGVQGEIGATGEPFKIKKTYASISEMNADFRNMEFGDYVMIASSVEVEDNAKLYTRGESAWIFISDFSGAMGIRGETGLTPNIKIGEVKTLEAGSQAKVTRSGSNEEPVFNFELPKGDKGDDYVLTEEDKVEIGEKVNTEYEQRIEQNEKYILELESTIDILTNTDTKKGELVHTTDALPLPTFETTADGNVEQETTNGKNLLPNTASSKTSNSVTFTKNKDGSITINGTTTATVYYEICLSGELQLKPGTYILSSGNVIPSSMWLTFNNNNVDKLSLTGKNSGTITLTENSVNAKVYIYINSGVTINNLTIYPMVSLEGGDYEPFTNGASPNPSYPQEIEVLEAYNLIGLPDVEETTLNGLTFSIKDGLLTLNGTTTNLVPLGNVLFNNPKETNKYKLQIFPQSGTWDNGWIGTRGYIDGTQKWYQQISKTDNINYVVKTLTVEELENNNRYDIYIPKNSSFDNFSCYVLFKKGEDYAEYLPYGCVGVKNVGKNLLPILNATKSYKQTTITCTNGIFHDITSRTGTTEYACAFTFTNDIAYANYANYATPQGNIIELEAGVYTYSYKKISGTAPNYDDASNGRTISVFEYKNTQPYTKIGSTRIIGDTASITFTLTKKTKITLSYAYYFNTNINSDVYFTLQLEKGSATDYEPYQEQIVPLDLKGNWVGAINDNIKDYLVTDKKKYWLVKNVGKIVLDGSENWSDFKIDSSGLGRALLTISDLALNVSGSLLMCNKLQCVKYSGSWNLTYDCLSAINNSKRIIIYLKDVSNITEFKNKLASGYEMLYPTEETEIIELGELPEPIKTFEGVNNIQLLANLDTEIEVVYAQDVKKYIDSKLAEISAQII